MTQSHTVRLFIAACMLLLACANRAGATRFAFAENLDNDKVKDSLIIDFEDGHFSSYDLHFAFSATKKTYDISLMFDSRTFIFMVPVPNEIVDEKKYVQLLRKAIMQPDFVQGNAELDWFAAACKSSTPSNSERVIAEYTFTPMFAKGMPELKTPHFEVLAYDKIACLADRYFGDMDGGDGASVATADYRRYVVINYLHNHGAAEKIEGGEGGGGEQYYKTKHGIFTTKKGSYAWLFVNEELILGYGSDMLRRPSVTGTEYMNNRLVIATRNEAETNYFVLDPGAATLTRMRNINGYGEPIADSIVHGWARELAQAKEK